jgi:hypothetical protein
MGKVQTFSHESNSAQSPQIVWSYKLLFFTRTFNKQELLSECWQNLKSEAVTCKHEGMWCTISEWSLFSFK